MIQLGSGDWFYNTLIWVLFFVLAFFYPKMLLTQILLRLGKTANLLDSFTNRGKEVVLKKISKKPSKEVKEKIQNFLEFFAIEPVNLDPYGIVKKIEHIVNQEEKRFKYFVKKIAGGLTEDEQADVMMGISADMSLYQMAKIIKHYIELIKKTKSYQLGVILQMQLPLIEKMSRALFKGVEALTNGQPIGDSVGPLVAAHFIKGKTREIEEDIVMGKTMIGRKKVLVVKPRGPGARLGKIGKAVDKLVKRYRTAKIITIDAAAKLESEKTGSVAEGVGVAMGGVGVDRAYIENIAVKKDIPLDSYIIKMSQEEAIMPMRMEVLNAVRDVVNRIKENIKDTKEKGVIILVGVGNTVGIPNNRDLDKVYETIRRNAILLKKWEEEEKRRQKELTGPWLPFGI